MKNPFILEDIEQAFNSSVEKDGYRLKVYQDEFVDDPEGWEDKTIIVSFHRHYGSSHGYSTMEDAIEDAKSKKLNSYIIHGYDHSGLTLSLSGDVYPFNDMWDAGIYGVLVTDKNKKEATEFIDIYNKYLNGWIYGFTLEKIKKCKCCGSDISEMVDSCGGFYDNVSILETIGEGFTK